MRATDLMVGDWVKSRGKIEQVTEVYDGFICTDSFEDSHDYYFKPVPLTQAILKKNGWKREFDKKPYMVKYDLGVDGKNCWMMWAIKEHNLDIQRQDEKLDMYNLKTQRACIPCDYVHELQHAMRLCGIVKEIVL